MNTENNEKQAKFPHLQREVEVLLEGFDHVAYGVEDNAEGESEWGHLNVDDVMTGNTKERSIARPRHSVVEKARLQEKKSDIIKQELLNRASNLQSGDVLLAKRNRRVVSEEVQIFERISNMGSKPNQLTAFLRTILKYLTF